MAINNLLSIKICSIFEILCLGPSDRIQPALIIFLKLAKLNLHLFDSRPPSNRLPGHTQSNLRLLIKWGLFSNLNFPLSFFHPYPFLHFSISSSFFLLFPFLSIFSFLLLSPLTSPFIHRSSIFSPLLHDLSEHPIQLSILYFLL